MRIVFQADPGATDIAWYEVLGIREGAFSLTADGHVVYKHPSEGRQWPAGESELQFRSAAGAWNTRCAAVSAASDDNQRDEIDTRFARELSDLNVVSGGESTYWDLLLEQVRHGLL